MRGLIDTLESREGHAKTLVNDAEQKGMEISEAKFKLRDVRQARLQSRTMVHAFNEVKFKEVVDIGLKTTIWSYLNLNLQSMNIILEESD